MLISRSLLFLLILIASAIIPYQLSAQQQTRLTGRILDARTDRPLEFSNITVMTPVDSTIVTGTVVDSLGLFGFPLDPGEYLIRVGFIGYEDYWREMQIQPGANDMGTVSLRPAAEHLGEVTVEAVATLFRSEFDRRIFNLEGTTVAEGGTALQVLETLPSIQVDEEGNLSMRGSGNVEIYINGRPTNLSSDETESLLEQYPADAIQSVELITNPSARFDAEGTGGIINLILKEQRMQGLNGQLNLSAGTGNKYNIGTTLNYRTGDWNFFTSYSYQYRELWERNESFRQYFTGEGSPFLDQNYSTTNWNQGHLLRTGIEYELSPNSNIRWFGNLNARGRDRERVYNIRNLDAALQLDSMFVRHLDEDQSRTNYEVGLNYDWQANGPEGARLDARLSFSLDEQDRIEHFDQLFFDSQQQEVPWNRSLQTYERPRRSSLLLGTLDYRLPLNENLNLEAGLRSTMRRYDLEQIFQDFDPDLGGYITDDLITNQFEYDQDIHAAYLILQNRLGSFSYQAGLRGEYTGTTSFMPENDSTITNNYFSLFPSIFLNYEISRNQDLQVNYSRRVRRPGTWAVTPFLNAQDFFNLRMGNPFLQPAFTNSYELSYLRGWDLYFLSATTYYRHTENALSRVFDLYDERFAVVTWVNSDTRRNLGLELVNQFDISRDIDATLTGNFFHSEISGANLDGQTYRNQQFSWTFTLLGNWNIPNVFNVQMMANYRGPIALPQGNIQPVGSINLGLRRHVWDRNATVSLNVSDVLNTRRFVLETQDGNLYQERRFMRESRIFTLSFIYRFGGFRERETPVRGDDMGGEEGLF